MLKTEDGFIGGGNGWRGGVMCEACERSPAVFVCKADAASLCAACDAEIHSANPLARRHHRVPIAGSTVADDEDEAASWLLMNPLKPNNTHNHNSNNGLFLLGREVDEEEEEEEDAEYLNFVEFHGCGGDGEGEDDVVDQFEELKSYGGGDSVVPIEFEGKGHHQMLQQSYGSHEHQLFQSSSKACYSYNGFLTDAISMSSTEVGVVPDSTTTTTIRPPKGTIDLFSGTVEATAVQMPATQLSPMDREARVLRYREKKKTRKFEKTIRYASRKAYAETRPRIKGRFAKRTDLDRDFSATAALAYGIVPSF